MPTRRNVLELLSASAVAAGCAGEASADPVAAWRNPGAGERDPRSWALAHAILAPNPHNRQPWQVELVGSDQLRLFVDTTRTLPATDPPNRQITLGCGAFLELLDLAARQGGRRAEIALWPQGEPQPVLDGRPVAHVRLVADPGVAADPLFDQITRRHTNRQPFDLDAPPKAADLSRIAAAGAGPGLAARIVSEPGLRARLIEIGKRAYGIEGDTKATHMETVRLMRIGAKEVAASPDGVALVGPFVETLRMTGQISRASLADPNSFASRSGLKMWLEMLEATPAFFVLTSADNSRTTQIAAGRAYARAQLTATALGLSMQPWSMGLEEFPEMAGPYAETQALLGATPQAPVQMLVRLGRAKPAPPAPRWPLASHIRA
jgi:hypothetical protein